MSKVTKKTYLTTVDGTPKKRSFLAIISDYDLKTGLCELIDNAIDHWIDGGRSKKLAVTITLDDERQFVQVTDDAGGIAVDDAELLVSPGASGNALDQASIGILGSVARWRLRSDFQTRGVRSDEGWETGLDLGVPPLQRVIVHVGDRWFVAVPIAHIMLSDLLREPSELIAGLGVS